MGNAPDALLCLTSLLMQGQMRPDGDDSVAFASAAPRRKRFASSVLNPARNA
jgi:hypothetical protein